MYIHVKSTTYFCLTGYPAHCIFYYPLGMLRAGLKLHQPSLSRKGIEDSLKRGWRAEKIFVQRTGAAGASIFDRQNRFFCPARTNNGFRHEAKYPSVFDDSSYVLSDMCRLG